VKRCRRKSATQGKPVSAPVPARLSGRWLIDFMSGATASSRKLRLFNIVDDFICERSRWNAIPRSPLCKLRGSSTARRPSAISIRPQSFAITARVRQSRDSIDGPSTWRVESVNAQISPVVNVQISAVSRGATGLLPIGLFCRCSLGGLTPSEFATRAATNQTVTLELISPAQDVSLLRILAHLGEVRDGAAKRAGVGGCEVREGVPEHPR
jgi:hypothetical protein